MRAKLFIVLAAGLLGGGAFAQSASRVPAPQEYTAFSRFVTERNIFDPNRVPNISSAPRTATRTPRATRPTSVAPPNFTYVGTMSYGKGTFAFFNGNNSDVRKALTVQEKIAGFTIAEIAATYVTLESADKKQRILLKTGAGLRSENGVWEATLPASFGSSSTFSEMPASASSSASAVETSAGAMPSAAPGAPVDQNEILKKLMQQREKETQ